MKIVNSHNEWDPLEEVIVGLPDFWHMPQKEPAFEPPYSSGKHSDEHIKQAAIQFDNLERVLKNQCNVTVRRPEIIDFREPVKTPFFSIEHQHGSSCPRDTLLVLGNEVIEASMSMRSRYFESMAYRCPGLAITEVSLCEKLLCSMNMRKILNDYMERDWEMLWTMAPKPTMDDSMYYLDFPWDVKSLEHREWVQGQKFQIKETQPVFDAAEVLRLGKDLLVQYSMTANRKGIEWLRRHTQQRGYRVHEIHFPDDMDPVHIDTTLVPVLPPTNERKGIMMTNPDRPILESDKKRIFEGSNWEIVEAPSPDVKTVPYLCQFTPWLSLNMLIISPTRAIVEEKEVTLIKFLESHGMKCIPIPHRDTYRFGGSLHCHTLDIRRKGECHNYFPNLDD